MRHRPRGSDNNMVSFLYSRKSQAFYPADRRSGTESYSSIENGLISPGVSQKSSQTLPPCCLLELPPNHMFASSEHSFTHTFAFLKPHRNPPSAVQNSSRNMRTVSHRDLCLSSAKGDSGVW